MEHWHIGFGYNFGVPCRVLLPAWVGRPGASAMSQSPIAQSQYSLARTPLLAGLPAEALEQIEGRCSWRRYEPGEPIVEYLDRSNDVFFLCEGDARVIIYSMSGKVVSFHDLVPGDMFGEYPAIDGRPRSASVEARTSCLVALMPAAAFRDLVQSEPAVTQALLKQLVATIRRLSTRVVRVQRAYHGHHRPQDLCGDAGRPRQGHLSQ